MKIRIHKTNDEAQIRDLINKRTQATQDKQIKDATVNYFKNVISFDVVGPLQYIGIDEMQTRLKEWFSAFNGPIKIDIQDLNITISNEVAFSYSFNHVNGTRLNGEQLDMWWRETLCYIKLEGKWVITHAHNSVPFDAKSGKASLALKPPEIANPLSLKSTKNNLSKLIKNYFGAYTLKNRKVVEELLSDEFTFTSPHDNHINKELYFKNCWPFNKEAPVYYFEMIVENNNEVLVLYECKIANKTTFRNTELFRFKRDKIAAIEVYFGNNL